MNSPSTCILDPFHTGSHAAWSKGTKEALEVGGHRVTMHTLPGRHWKWRMHGAAATWMQSLRHQPPPDVVVTTDMCDVAQLRGTMPSSWRDVKVATMFHENQLTFPWSPEDPDSTNGRDNTYAFINIALHWLWIKFGSAQPTIATCFSTLVNLGCPECPNRMSRTSGQPLNPNAM